MTILARVKNPKLIAVALLIITALLSAGMAKHIFSYSYELPDPDAITTPGGGPPPNLNVDLTISQSGPNIFQDVDYAWAKIFYPSSVPDLRLQIADGDFGNCGINTDDTEGDNASCNDANAVDYEFYYGNNTDGGKTPQPGAPFAVINSSALTDNDFQTTPAFPLPGYAPINTGDTTNYIVFVKARWVTGGPGSDRINGFRIGGYHAGTLDSYWGNYNNTSSAQPSDAGYSVQDRISPQDTEVDMSFDFATPCSVTDSPTVYLKWRDADAYGATNQGIPEDGNEFPNDQEINFELQEANIGATSGGAILSVNYPPGSNPDGIGGQGDYKYVSFTARPDKVYIWKWRGVNRYNGVQMWIPYDTFYFDKKCGPPPAPDHGVDGRVFNDINGNGSFEPGSGEYLIKTPGATCDGQHTDADAKITADGNTGNLALCNGPGFGAPFDPAKTYALFHVKTTACGNVTVTVNPPPGWEVTVGKGPTRNFNVPCGNGYAIYSNDVNDYFGIRKGQGVQGRVFIDDNNNGTYEPGIDQIIRNPSGVCSNANIFVGGVSVMALSNGNTSLVDKCNDPFPSLLPGPAGTLYALWQVSTPPGPQKVQVTVPTDWVINSKTDTRTYTVPVGGYGGPTTEHDYFGMLPRKPDLTPYCLNSNSLAQISWPTAGFSGNDYYVDVSTSSSFGSYSYKHVVGGSRTINDAPNNFIGSLSSGNVKFTEGGTYYARIFYAGPNVHSAVYQFTADKCPKLRCGTLNPSDVESLDTGTDVRVSFTNIGQGPLANTAVLNVSYPGYAGNAAYSPNPLPGGNTTAISNSGAIPFTKPAGKYKIRWTVTGDPRSNSLNGGVDPVTGGPECEAEITVSDKPYFKAYGSDVVVGITQPPGIGSCSGWNSAAGSSILAFSSSASAGAGAGKGAGGQLAVYALGAIDGFVSTAGQTASSPAGPSGTGILPNGLTFANTTAGYGGGSQLPWCPPDYFNAASRPASASASLITNLVGGVTGIADGSYYIDGSSAPLFGGPVILDNAKFVGAGLWPLPLLGQPPLDSGSATRPARKIVIFVKGNVEIDNDITFDTNNWSVGKIPSLYVIATGNIYIQPNVKQIDGVYVAQESSPGVGGIIYTCANGAAPPPNQGWLISNCYTAPPSGASTKKLLVNGTLIAQHLRLFRLVGTRFLGSTQELSSSNNIAEMVNSGPETWLTIPAPYPPSTIDGYDAATSLPPTL